MLIKLNKSTIFNLSAVETVGMSLVSVNLSFRGKAFATREKDEVAALRWLFTVEGMNYASRAAGKTGFLDLIPTYESYQRSLAKKGNGSDGREQQDPPTA